MHDGHELLIKATYRLTAYIGVQMQNLWTGRETTLTTNTFVINNKTATIQERGTMILHPKQ